MDVQTEKGLKEALGYLESGQPEKALEIVSSLFETDLDSKELMYTNRCCNFWIDVARRVDRISDPFERSESLLMEWRMFRSFMARDKFVYEPAFYSFQRGFFSMALKNYTEFFDSRDPQQKAEAYRKAGICYKKIGEFENARGCLAEANSLRQGVAPVLAELADCYSLCGEDKYGKVLFREAFFIDPDSIELDFLDSELIKCLADRTAEKGYSGKALLEWIPVYGVIFGIFNIKRELHAQEVGRLKKNIYAMENEYKDPSCDTASLTPRLLNSYFWLIDHYILKHEDTAKVNEILLKIKILDSNIYGLYMK